MKVGIITFHSPYNYGCMLQAYALQTKLRTMGAEVIGINFRSELQMNYYALRHQKYGIKRMIKAWLKRTFFVSIRTKMYRFEQFLLDYLELTPLYKSIEEIAKNCPEFDVYISGSDQIWNPEPLDFSEAYFLPFAGKHKRISYAASFGPKGQIPDSGLKKDIVRMLREYQSISVREQKSAELIKDLIGLEVPVVLDPVFFLSVQQWDGLISSAKCTPKTKYILFYTVSYDEVTYRILNEISKQLQLAVVITKYCAKADLFSLYIKKVDSGPIEFLSLMKNAEFVFTSSFHGTAFSILYNKPFFAYNGSKDARIATLLESCGLLDRAIDEENAQEKLPLAYHMDFSQANEKLKIKIRDSEEYLNKALFQ